MKTLKSVAKYVALAVAILFSLAYLAQFVVGWWAEARVEKKLAALRAAGEPITLIDLARNPIPPDDDAATYLRQARSDLEAIDRALESLAEEDKSELYLRYNLSSKAKETIGAALADHSQVFPLLERAAACPDLDPQLTLTEGTDAFYESFGQVVGLTRYVNDALRCRALMLLADGRSEEALAVSLTMFRLARLSERAPTTAGYIHAEGYRSVGVQIANLSLRTGPITTQTQDALDVELARVDAIKSFRWALASERASGSPHFEEFYDDLGARRFHAPILWITKMNDYYAYLNHFDEPMQLIERPYQEVRERVSILDGARFGGVVSALLSMPPKALIEMSHSGTAMIRSLRVFNAVKRRDPSSENDKLNISDLGLPSEATTDPFTGGPLKMVKHPAGWIIYSVGSDLQDEGGRINPFHDPGVGPRETWADAYD